MAIKRRYRKVIKRDVWKVGENRENRNATHIEVNTERECEENRAKWRVVGDF